MTTHFRILLGVSVALCAFSAASLHAQPPVAGQLPGAHGGGMQNSRDTRKSRTHGEASRPMEVSVVTGKEADGKLETTTLAGHRLQRFQYVIGSFKPVEIPSADLAAGGMMDMMGGAGGMMGGYGAMMGGGGYGGGGMMGGEDMVGMGGGMMAGPRAQVDDSTPSQRTRTITILAFVLDERQEDGRAKIELLTLLPSNLHEQGNGGYGGGEYVGGMMGDMAMGGGYGGGSERSAATPMHIGTYIRLSELADRNVSITPADARLAPEEYQIVSQLCQLKIWKADAVAALQSNANPAEDPQANTLAEKEQHLKQLLTEEFDVQLARQELEVRTIEQRTAALKQEIERRRQAKDRVIDVQLGRIVLEAQGLLGR